MPENTNSTTDTDSERSSSTDSIVTSATAACQSVEEGITSVSDGVWEFFHDRPRLGAVVSGGVGFGCAMAFGFLEVTAFIIAGYLGYRVFAYGESFSEAMERTIQARKGELPEDKF